MGKLARSLLNKTGDLHFRYKLRLEVKISSHVVTDWGKEGIMQLLLVSQMGKENQIPNSAYYDNTLPMNKEFECKIHSFKYFRRKI